MKRPNFFIIGAPKCGTTALYTYLASHPNIYLPKVKEPHYFAADLPVMRVVDKEESYLALFDDAGPEHLAVGEASVMYLYSSVAVQNIFEFAPDARLIVMLRNPLELVYSYHSQLRYGFHEQEKDFERAWALQAARREGRHLPPRATDAAMLQYKAVGELGRQVERLLDIFPADQVKLILFDDFKKSPKLVYDEVLDFLGVPSDNRTDFPKINSNKEYYNPVLARLVVALQTVQRRVKRLLGLQPSAKKRFLSYFNILHLLRKLNTRNASRAPLPEAFRRSVLQEFKSDIERLSKILGRDLSHWLE